MIKLIASDLDGTLLKNGAQELGTEIYTLIRELKNLGILFVAASGRQYANLRRLFEPVKDEIAYIAENGCLLFYKGKVLHKDVLERELGQEILHSIWNKEGAEVLLSGEQTSYIQPKKDDYYHLLKNVVKNNVTRVEDIFAVQEEYMKISAFVEEGVEQVEDYWKEEFSSRATVVTSGNAWLDITPIGANKGSAMKKMQEYFDIKPEECMAFGDHYNDVEMLESVKYSYAMDSGQSGIHTIANYHTDKVETILKKIIANEGEIRE